MGCLIINLLEHLSGQAPSCPITPLPPNTTNKNLSNTNRSLNSFEKMFQLKTSRKKLSFKAWLIYTHIVTTCNFGGTLKRKSLRAFTRLDGEFFLTWSKNQS